MLFALALSLAFPNFANVQPIRVGGVLCHPTRLFVQATDAGSLNRISANGAKVVRTFPEIGYTLVETPAGSLQNTRRRLANAFGEDRVDLDRAGQPAYAPNDTLWPSMWHPQAINADKAWDVSLGSNKAIVALMDTGVDITHEDLVANIYTNPGEIPDNGIDDDGNGYVDDVHGYDFANNDNDPNDVYGHGTCCAGLAAAVGNNGIGSIGIAPRATILPCKTATDDGYFYDSATIPAYLYAQKMGAKVYSMSYFADHVSKPEGAALQWASNHGVLPIAAACNSGSIYPFYPGAYEFVLSVAAVNPDLSKAGFSDYGSWVDVAAPGVGLTTTTVGNGYTNGFAGTSGACPVVAGLAALLFGIKPGASPITIRRCIEESATLQTQDPYGEFTNYGLVNAQLAVQLLKGATYTPKKPIVRWISPVGAVDPVANPNVQALVYGRNLTSASAIVNGVAAATIASAKDRFTYRLPTANGQIVVQNSAGKIATVQPPFVAGYEYPLIEASEPGGSVYGGFFETIKKDGKTLMATQRSDGAVVLEATFRNLPHKGKFWLTLDRSYPSATAGIESIELYDWSTWSYPYASFITLSSEPAPATMTRIRVLIPDISRYVDFQGTAYFRIETTSDLTAGSSLSIDTAYLKHA